MYKIPFADWCTKCKHNDLKKPERCVRCMSDKFDDIETTKPKYWKHYIQGLKPYE